VSGQRHVTKHQPDLAAGLQQRLGSQQGFQLLAVGALEIGEQHQGDGSGLRAAAGMFAGQQFGHYFLGMFPFLALRVGVGIEKVRGEEAQVRGSEDGVLKFAQRTLTAKQQLVIATLYALVLVQAEVIRRGDTIFLDQVTGEPRRILWPGLAAIIFSGRSGMENRSQYQADGHTHDGCSHFLSDPSCR